MKATLIQCIEVPQGHKAYTETKDGVERVEIWDMSTGEILVYNDNLTADDVFCVSSDYNDWQKIEFISHKFMCDINGNCLYKTKKNVELDKTISINAICKAKTEVTIEQFIKICKK